MALSITSRQDRNFHVLTLAGNLTLGPNLTSLHQMSQTAIEGTAPDGLILDVAGVRYTDSAGLGELTRIFTLCNRKQCVLVLTGVTSQLKQMLELTRLDALLPSASDVEAAKRFVKLQVQKKRGISEAAGES